MTTCVPRPRAWVWFFLALAVLGGTGLTIEVWYNLSQQLTAAQVQNAREIWAQNGPRNYDFTYNVTRQTRDPADIAIAFRSGRAVDVRVESRDWTPELAALYALGPALAARPPEGGDGEVRVPGSKDSGTHEYRVRVRGGSVVEVRCDGKVLPAINPAAFGMEGLYTALARQRELDSEPGRPRVFAVGTFGKGDRRLLRYVRSCRALRERVEVKFVELIPVEG